MLFAVGAPITDELIRPGAMFIGLLRTLDAEGVAVTKVAQVAAEELAEVCASFRPDIVHLVAHGSLDEDGRAVLHLRGHRPAQAGDVPRRIRRRDQAAALGRRTRRRCLT